MVRRSDEGLWLPFLFDCYFSVYLLHDRNWLFIPVMSFTVDNVDTAAFHMVD